MPRGIILPIPNKIASGKKKPSVSAKATGNYKKVAKEIKAQLPKLKRPLKY